MVMRVKCNRCGSVAVIKDSSAMSEDMKNLYCSCSNPRCGHGFVTTLSYSHTISPSALDFSEETLEKIKKMNRPQQQEIFAGLRKAPARQTL